MNGQKNSSTADLRSRIGRFLARNGTWLGVVALILVFYAINDRFLTLRNAETIGRQIAEMGVLAIPLGLLVISGSVDLSVGSITSMAGVVAAQTMLWTGNGLAGAAAGLVFGALAGALNGFLVTKLSLNPIVVTLGFLAAWAGAALYWTGGATLAGLPPGFTRFGTFEIYGLPVQVLILLAAIFAGWWALNRNYFGRYLYAVGDNERSAFLMGIRVNRVRFFMFVNVGAAAGLAGLMLIAKLQAAPPTLGAGMELSVLTVILLGGVAFAGGSGRISGIVAGLLFVGILQNGLVVIGTSQFIQQILVGLTLVIAIALDDTLRAYAVGRRREGPLDAGPDQGNDPPHKAAEQSLQTESDQMSKS